MAIGTATAILAGTTVLSGLLGRKAAKDSARVEEKGAEAGIDETRRQFDITTGLQRPIFEAGDTARNELLASLGLSGEEAEADFFDRFKETRGQQFLREQQEKSTTRNAAALGQRLGGNVLTALQEQAEGRAAGRLGEFQNRLAQLSGAGQQAATATGQFGQVKSANVSNLLNVGARAKSTGILGANKAVQSGIEGLTSIFSKSGIGSNTPQTILRT